MLIASGLLPEALCWRPHHEFYSFLDAGESVRIDDLTIENGTERIALYGRLEIRRDRIGLQDIQALKAQIDAIARELEDRLTFPSGRGAHTRQA